MSEFDAHIIVKDALEGLLKNDRDKVLACISEDAVLSWGPYIFEGRDAIRAWAADLWGVFGEINIAEKSFAVTSGGAQHSLFLVVTARSGQEGMLPIEATYALRDGKIQGFKMGVLPGLLCFDEKDLAP